MASNGTGPQSGCATGGLPVVGQPGSPRERADAARNRLRVLAAAEALFAERGVAGVTMDDVAAAAGVGKGTLYRRFGDKGGLGAALLDQRGAELQRQLLEGPPPLGPGAEPAERLVAFARAYLGFQAAHLDLVLMSETSTPGGRLRKGSYGFWRRHAELLLRAAGAPDAAVRAEVLLAGLSAEQVRWWVRDQGRTPTDLEVAVTGIASALAGGA
ncbi:TetR/AcrR family transcriptional regulator [Geodermatophilus sp. SYSU D00815]